MFCQKCGAPLSGGARICPQCGAEVETRPEAPAAAAVETPEPPMAAEPAPSASYDEGTYSYYTGDQVQEAPKAPPKKKRRWILPVVLAAVLLLALAVGGFLTYQKIYNTPERQVMSAALRTWLALEEQTGEMENLEEMLERYAALLASRSYETITTQSYSYSAQIETQTVSRTDGTTIRGSTETFMDFYTFAFEYSADKDSLLLRIPELSDDLFRVPLSNFGAEFQDSALASSLERDAGVELPMEYLQELKLNFMADVRPQAYLDAEPEMLERLKTCFTLSETEERIAAAPELRTFRVDCDLSILPELLDSYIRFVLNSYLGSERCTDAILEALELDDLLEAFDTTETPYMLLGINSEKQLVALHFATEAEDDEPGTLLLCGENNPWEKICFYTGHELDGAITMTRTDSGFELDVDEGDTILTLDDAAGLISITEYGEPLCTMEYKVTEEGLCFHVDMDSQTMTTTMEPLTEAVTHLEGEPTELLDMDLYELSELLMVMFE